jgi:hypothetical protein
LNLGQLLNEHRAIHYRVITRSPLWGKSRLIRHAKQRIRHIDLYRASSSIESLPDEPLAMKHERENQEKKAGWLVTVEFVKTFTNRLVKKEKFLVYSKNSKALEASSIEVVSFVLKGIVIKNDASYPINLQNTEPLVKVEITKELLDEPVYYETDNWRCAKLSVQRVSSMRVRSTFAATLVLAAAGCLLYLLLD